MEISYERAKEIIIAEIEESKLVDIYAVPSYNDEITIDIIEQYNLEEDKQINQTLTKVKAKLCQEMLETWLVSDKPQLQISAYKMLASKQQRINLTGAETPDVSGVGKDNEIVVRTVYKKCDIAPPKEPKKKGRPKTRPDKDTRPKKPYAKPSRKKKQD